jgi:hypothetical protein
MSLVLLRLVLPDLEVLMLAFHLVEVLTQNDVVLTLVGKHEGHLHKVQVIAPQSSGCTIPPKKGLITQVLMAAITLACVLSSLSDSIREATCIMGVSPLPPAIMPALTVHRDS